MTHASRAWAQPTAARGTAARAAGLHAVAAEHSTAERDAERVAEAGSNGTTAAPGWSFADVGLHAPEPVDGPLLDVRLDGPGRPLPAAGSLGSRTDLADIRVHTDEAAADTTRRAGAQALTAGRDIAFAPGRFQPDTREGRRLIAHEVAHAAQSARAPGVAVAHRDGKGPVASATTLEGLPDADRKRVQVVSTTRIPTPTQEKLKKEYFDKGTTINGPSDTTIETDASVPAALSKGLTNIAGDWSTANVGSPVLTPNSTFTIDLDLTAHGGSKAAYRFTFTQPPATRGKPAAGRILVEQLGAKTPPAGTAKPPAPKQPGAPAPPDPVEAKIKSAGITRSGFSATEEDALRAAIALTPDAHLAAVSGLKFARGGVDKKDPKVAGRYFQKQHKVVMYDNAFVATDVEFVEGGTAASYATRAILHEIGHAVDLRPLQQANDTLDSATAAVNAAAGTFTTAEQRRTYDDAVRAETAAKAALRTARSRSGTKTVAKPLPPGTRPGTVPTDYEDVIGTAPDGNKFREAVKKDGGKAVSTYGEEDYQESYAEAYSLFLTTPSQLMAIRPATYDYFVKNSPGATP